MSGQLGIIGYDYLEFYVGSAKMWAYWHAKAMGFQLKGLPGTRNGCQGPCFLLYGKEQASICTYVICETN